MEAVNTNQTNVASVQSSNQEAEDMISLREILDMFLFNWRWFILSAAFCLGLSLLYLKTKPNVFQRQAVMLVKDDNGGGRRGSVSTDALMSLNGVIAGSSVKNEVYILRSHQLMMEVVRKLDLDVQYQKVDRFHNVSLYDVKPFKTKFLEEDSVKVASFRVNVLNKNEVRVYDMRAVDGRLDFDKVVRFGQQVKTPIGTFTLIPDLAHLDEFIDQPVIVTHLDQETAANVVGGQIATGEMDKESTLVRLTCTDTNVQRADDILSALLEAYKQSIIEDKNKLAQSTADFIDERIRLISRELGEVEGDLAQFKQNNNLVDIGQNASAYMSQASSARQRTIALQAQQVTIKYLMDYLKENSEGNRLIPSLGGVTDVGVQSQIAKYNDLMLQRNHLVENSSENNVTVRELDANLKQMKQTIVASMTGYAASIDVQVRHALAEEKDLQSTLSTVPQKERQVLDIARQQKIKETLYTYLLNKREETALQLAISEANIRIVEQPFGSLAPIAPRRQVTMLAALLIGFVLPFIIIYGIGLLNMGVRGRRDIEVYTTIPVIGEIPHVREGFDESKIMVSEKSNDTVSEAFRLLRFNLGFVKKDARVIMFTSTLPNEGKTFISRNFAHTLSLAGKRVILIDTDIRKRTQTALYDASRKEGLTSYLNGSEEDLSNLIVPGNEKYSVDLLPAGVRPPNPAELLMSDRLDQLIAHLKEMYDYVVIDNVPAQIVADAGIVNRLADLTIYVVRDRKIDRRYLPELERMHKENKFNNLTILLNDARLDKKNYGYYGYGAYSYYTYSYKYGYGYGYGNSSSGS